MLRRAQGSLLGVRRRLSAFASGFVDTFLRDNKVIPVMLALLALFVFAWVVAGALLDGPDEKPVSNRGEVAQAQDPPDPPAPEIQNRNLDSYAAYQSKDPFRQLFSPAETTTTTTPTTAPTTTPTTTAEDTTGGAGAGGAGAGGGLDGTDSDGDGLSDRREFNLGLDPANPDSDGDGTLDGQDDEARGRAGGGAGGGRGGAGDGRGAGGRNDLPESGGEVPLR